MQHHDPYLEQKTIEALRLAKQDWAEASRLLCSWVEEDHKLLLSLTHQYLRGAAAQSVQNVARKREHQAEILKELPPRPTPAPVKVNAPAKTLPLTRDKGNFTNSVWDEIITQMQEMPDMDAVQHEKALRTIAKAFVAKRFDAHDESKDRYRR